LFINAQTGVLQPEKATNSLIRVGVVAFAPIAINAGVLAVLFGMACCMGPVLSMCCKKFGSVLAAIAHAAAVIMLLAFFEVMFFLLPAICVPYVDKFHSVMLFWLRPRYVSYARRLGFLLLFY